MASSDLFRDLVSHMLWAHTARSHALSLAAVMQHLMAVQELVNAAELKRIIEGLPLETSAVAAVEWRLGQLEPSQFAALLTELARDNHAFRCDAASVSNPIAHTLGDDASCSADDHAHICALPVLKEFAVM